MVSQGRCLLFFFYINETHTILCGSFKKKKVTRHAREEKHMTILISEMTWEYTAGLAFRARIEILEHTLSQNLKLLAEVGYG